MFNLYLVPVALSLLVTTSYVVAECNFDVYRDQRSGSIKIQQDENNYAIMGNAPTSIE